MTPRRRGYATMFAVRPSNRDSRSARHGRLRTADIVGVPVMPPGRAIGLVTAMRSILIRLHRATAPPPLQVVESLLGILDQAGLVALCQLGVPEQLRSAMTIDSLADAVGADAEHLERLVRFAAVRGWVRLGRDGRVRPTRTTAFLRADHPGGWRDWVQFASSPEIAAAIGAMGEAARTGSSGFQQAHDAPFFAWMADHPHRHAVFDRAMDAGGRLHALALSAALPWSASRRVCDVGGGTGALLTGLLGSHPHLDGVVFDLPDVVDRAHDHDRIQLVGGDAFVGVPTGCDTYLLVNVLHDWGDDEVVVLLSRVGDALEPSGRLIVVEGERTPRPRDGLPARTDLLMLALTGGGKERTTAEFSALGARAGLRLHHSVNLASADRAHVFVSADDRAELAR